MALSKDALKVDPVEKGPAIQRELLKVTNLKVSDGESQAEFYKRLALATNKLSDDAWEKLSEKAQEWANEALSQIKKGGTIPSMSEVEFDIEPPRADEPKLSLNPEKENGMTDGKATSAKKPASKKSPAPKKAKGAGAKAGKAGRRGKFEDGAKITVVGENPWREGTKGAKNFNKYKSGMTVGEAIKAGVPHRHINRSVERSAIKVA